MLIERRTRAQERGGVGDSLAVHQRVCSVRGPGAAGGLDHGYVRFQPYTGAFEALRARAPGEVAGVKGADSGGSAPCRGAGAPRAAARRIRPAVGRHAAGRRAAGERAHPGAPRDQPRSAIGPAAPDRSQGLAGATGSILLTPNERRVAEDRRDCYWLYVVTDCAAAPNLQKPIRDPARYPWHEVTKVAHYYLSVNALQQPMEIRETDRGYNAEPKP